MNITCSKETLLKGIRIAESLLITKNIGKNNILLDASDDLLKIFATDSETSVIVNLKADISKNGSLAVFGKKIIDILSNLPEQDVIITSTEENILKIKSLEKSINALFSLKGIPKNEYATIPSIEEDAVFKIGQMDLKNMIRKVISSASNDDMRYVLNGILFSIKRKSLKLIATDGRRLSVITKDIEGPSKDENIIISKKVLSELEKLLGTEGECQIGFSSSKVFFHFDNIHIISRLIEGDFPDYQQVVPKTTEREVVFKKEELFNAVKRISLIVDEKYKKITITVKDNKAIFDSQDPDVGEAFEEINCVSVKPPFKEDFVISFNSFFLLDVLRVIETDEVVFLFNQNINPVIIKEKDSDSFLSIIMPMKSN